MLVEDRDECRISTKWFLSNLGYTVDAVRGGPEALLLFQPGIHDAVVLGESTPGMSNAELAHIVKLRAPATPVIVCAAEPVANNSCIDLVLPGSPHPLVLKAAVENLLARQENLAVPSERPA